MTSSDGLGARAPAGDPYARDYLGDLGWQGRRRATAAGAAKTLLTVAVLTLPVGFILMLALGLNANVIVSGSMEPAVPVGSLVLYETVAADELRSGDVISFERPDGDHAITTHRIVAVEERDGTRVFQTKGDNNPIADPWLIRYDAQQEPKRMIASIPYVGHLLLVTKAPLIKILLIVLVLGFLYVSFLRVLSGGAERGTR